MAGEQAAAAAEFDYEKLAAAMAKANAAALAEANKPVLDALTKLATPAPAAEKKDGAAAATAAADAPKPLTAADVARLLDERDAARQTTQQQQAERGRTIAEKLAGVPKAYQDRLGADPAKWADEARAIREEFKKDFTALGGKLPDVGGEQGGGGGAGGAGVVKPGGAVDFSKQSATSLIEMGLKQMEPNGLEAAIGGQTAAVQGR